MFDRLRLNKLAAWRLLRSVELNAGRRPLLPAQAGPWRSRRLPNSPGRLAPGSCPAALTAGGEMPFGSGTKRRAIMSHPPQRAPRSNSSASCDRTSAMRTAIAASPDRLSYQRLRRHRARPANFYGPPWTDIGRRPSKVWPAITGRSGLSNDR